MSRLIELIKSDLARISDPTVLGFLKTYFNPHSVCFRYLVNLRVVQAAKRSNIFCKVLIGLPCHLILVIREILHDINVPTNIPIGKGMHIVHGGGIFLNVSKIGDNFTVFQNVTLGKRHKNDGVPIIGNNVTCYTGCVICGPVLLGDFSKVGANTYVDKDVPEGGLVIGASSRIIINK